MAEYSVTEARAQLSRLIDPALEGETVIITQRGRPVVQLNAVAQVQSPRTAKSVRGRRAKKQR